MPTAASVGTTTFREISVEPVLNRSGMDSLTVILKGRSSALATEIANWTRGRTYPGYPTMYLETRSHVDRGPVAEITLNFIGLLSTASTENGAIDFEDSITRQSVSITTDEDENVNFQYYAQSTTTRWISRGPQIPTTPKFKGRVPTEVPVNALFAPDPPNYSGSIAGKYKGVGRLAQFTRSRVAPGVWMVVETWEIMVEPKND